jgi:hypothetical protein
MAKRAARTALDEKPAFRHASPEEGIVVCDGGARAPYGSLL